MTFKTDEVQAFIDLFNETKSKIRHFEGCTHLELMQDYSQGHIFSTYSKWESEDALNCYRESALFGEVWKATKAKFAEKPVAFSLKGFIQVD